jgi:hypothetical protein
VLFHYTDTYAAKKILSSGNFELSSVVGNRSEEQYAPAGHPYFLSLTRTVTGDYHRWVSTGAVLFKLDGDWFNSRYIVKPIDYWERSWLHSNGTRSRESEDRVFSKTPEIPINAVTEVHVLLKEQSEVKSPSTRQLMISAKQRGLPVYFYTDEAAWRLLDKRKAKSPSKASDVLKGSTPSRIGSSRKPSDSVKQWVELVEKNKIEQLSDRAQKQLRNLMYYSSSNEDNGMGVDLSNARKPHSSDRTSAVSLISYMQKNGYGNSTVKLKNDLAAKWKPIWYADQQIKQSQQNESLKETSGYIPNPQDIPQNILDLHKKHERITAMANERIPSEPNAKGVYPRPQDLKREQTMSFRRLFNAVEKFTGDTSGDPSGPTMQMLTRLSELSRAENEKDVEEGFLNEASGYIPTAAEAHDPRYEMALTVDVRPGALGKAANSFLLNTDSQGHPQELRPDGLVQRMTEELALFKKKPTMKIHELIFESKKTYTLGGFPVKPIHIENQEVGEAIKIDAPQKPWAKQDMQDYLNRIKTDTKTKRDRFNPIIHGSNIKAIVKADGTSEWDLDDLKNQITTPPQSLFGKNAKMIKGEKEGTITYDLTLPALSGMVVDEETGEFVEITTCPGAEECQHYCYARKGGYVMFPDSSMSSARALNFLVNHPKEYMAMFDSEVKQAKIKAKKNNVKLEVRIHDAGDYFSKEYWNLSKQVQNANPDANFYFYSKNGDIITDPDKPANTLANFSANGAQKREINKVDTYKSAGNNVKGTLVIPKDMFRDLFVTDAKGKYIKDEAGRTQVKSNKAWTQFKQQLASKYNVDPKSIITYDQMVKKKEPRPIGKKDKLMSDGTVKKVSVYAPAKWNVVVFPAGHGDLGATRHDVQNQFLMFH